jgi:hypothetical protein
MKVLCYIEKVKPGRYKLAESRGIEPPRSCSLRPSFLKARSVRHTDSTLRNAPENNNIPHLYPLDYSPKVIAPRGYRIPAHKLLT